VSIWLRTSGAAGGDRPSVDRYCLRVRGEGSRAAGYRRSVGSARGEARRRDLVARVTDDLAVHGLVDFSLRRAAAAAGTTHKVLLYHFDGPEDLLAQAMTELRRRRISEAASLTPSGASLAERVRALWPVLTSGYAWVHDQAMGLMMYDPGRYIELGRGSSQQYLPTLLALCPEDWSDRRRTEVAEMIMATLRGFVIDRLASGDSTGVDAGFEALARALDREEAFDR
jgi:AcrR family transcriptional regulator